MRTGFVLLCFLRLLITNSRAEKNSRSRSYHIGILKGDVWEVEIDVYSGQYRQHYIPIDGYDAQRVMPFIDSA